MKPGGRAGRSAMARVSVVAAVLASISFLLAGFLALPPPLLPDKASRPSRFLESGDDGGDADLPLISIPFQTSLHGSCPVIKGEKWVTTKWIRNQEQD